MILAVDVGNTNITLGGFNADTLRFTARLATDRSKTRDQYAVDLLQILRLYAIEPRAVDDGIISSVVPELSENIADALEHLTGRSPLRIGPGVKSGLNIRIDDPAELGADLVCTAVGAIKKYPLPCLVLDLGTATKISVIDETGAYLGCTISPGVKLSLNALSSGASQLPGLQLDSPRSVIGTNSIASMQSGVVLGTASMLDGLCDRIDRELKTPAKTIVATGGLAERIVRHCEHTVIYDADLVLDGLLAIYKKNRKKRTAPEQSAAD